MEIGKQLKGFLIRNKYDLGKQGILWELEHEKTVAKLAWLDNGAENKVFSITYKTTPEDGTGVFHILEHSVLNGSESFPTKKLFVELMKGSLNTYLNAATYPDKTMYPVSSRNEKDFFNLAKVYLDCTLFPMVLQEKHIFEQEQSVVLNEMKGVFSSPEDRLANGLPELLFPDTYLGNVAGGNPAQIPNLTYEQLKAFHAKYYHPTNSYVYLDGAIDIEKMLELIDSYFSRFEKGVVAEYEKQTPAAVSTKTDYYLSFDEEDLALYSCGRILPKEYTREEYLAFSVLCNYMVGTNESPLKKAILETGIAYDMNFYVDSENAQPYLVLGLYQMDPSRKEEAVAVAKAKLSELCEQGVAKEELYAEIDQLEYLLKDIDEPTGLMRNGIVVNGWTYYNNPVAGMDVDADLAVLRAFVENGRYQELLCDLTLDQCSEFLLLPGADFDEEDEAEPNPELLAWQNAEEDEKALSTIPKLSVDDIKEKITFLDTEYSKVNDSDVLFHEFSEGEINHYSLFFSLADCTVEEMQILSFMTNLFNCLPTENYDLPSLEKEMKLQIGEVDYNVVAYSGNTLNECQPMYHVSFSTLANREEKSFELIAEILRRTCFTGELCKELIFQILLQGREDLFQAIMAEGSRYASLRASSHLQAGAALIEQTEGYTFYQYISEIADHYEERIDDFIAKMSVLPQKIFSASRMTVSITAAELGDRAERITKLFVLEEEDARENGTVCTNQMYTLVPDGKCEMENITMPSHVGYAAFAGLLPNQKADYCGQYEVLANLMDLGHLWTKIRVQGGAYGCGSYVSRNGGYGFSSYRDPNPEESLKVFEECYQITDTIPDDIENYIIGAYAANTPLLNSRRLAAIADGDYFVGITKEDREKTLQEILSTTSDSLKELLKKLAPVEGKCASCIISGDGPNATHSVPLA